MGEKKRVCKNRGGKIFAGERDIIYTWGDNLRTKVLCEFEQCNEGTRAAFCIKNATGRRCTRPMFLVMGT
jgi:hypothetical protein